MTSSHLHISSNQSPSGGSPSPRGSSSNNNGSTNQACAACKYQRRKCNPDCPLAPYFPADQQRRFLNAHRLFGVSNILKTIRRLRPELCAEAMGSLIFQAEMRAQDPVGGCYRLILGLERQIDMDRAELAAILHHLAICRHQASASAMPAPADLDVTSSCNHQQTVLLNSNAADDQEVVVDALYANHQEVLQATEDHHNDDQGGGHNNSPQQAEHHGGGEQQNQLFDYFYYDTAADAGGSGKPIALDINVDAMHHFDYDDDQKLDMAPAVHEEQQQLVDVNCHIDQVAPAVHEEHHHLDDDDHKDYDIKSSALLVDVFDMRLPVVVDENDDTAERVNYAHIDINAEVDLNQELHDRDTKNNIAVCEEPQMAAVESSQCRLGLAFSAS